MSISLEVIKGFQGARYITVTFLTLLVYDQVLILDEEVAYIWTARWSATKVLYLLNRILPIGLFILQSIINFDFNLSISNCQTAVLASEVLNGMETFVIGTVLTLRVYYLWSRRPLVQALVVVSFISALAAGVVLGIRGKESSRIPIDNPQTGINHGNPMDLISCMELSTPVGNVGSLWMIFIPVLVYQTLLFGLTMLRLLYRSRDTNNSFRISRRKHTSLMTRVVRDGSIFYVVVLACVVLIMATGHANSPGVVIPLFWTNFITVALAVCIARLILSIRSLAASLSSEPSFLLNNAELTRLHHRHRFREGTAQGEVVVEMSVVDGDGTDTKDGGECRTSVGHEPPMLPVTTRVGVFEDNAYSNGGWTASQTQVEAEEIQDDLDISVLYGVDVDIR